MRNFDTLGSPGRPLGVKRAKSGHFSKFQIYFFFLNDSKFIEPLISKKILTRKIFLDPKIGFF